jgi:hypothetical protein
VNWRIYRLPGSREWWLIDHGPGSLVLRAKYWEAGAGVRTRSVNGDPTKQPIAWIWVSQSDLYLSNAGAARFEGPRSCA